MTPFGRRFRMGPISRRRQIINGMQNYPLSEDFDSSGRDESLVDLSEAMVEQAVGYMAIPMGLAGPILVDDRKYMIPIATEEPSVVAAATYAGHLVNRHGGIKTQADSPVMSTHVYLENVGQGGEALKKIRSLESKIRASLTPLLASMEARGGGWRGMEVEPIPQTGTVRVSIKIDVRDAMGANLLNSLAEKARPLLEKASGSKGLMAILSNSSRERTAAAQFSLPATALGRPGYDGMETAGRIVRAALVAQHDAERAVTHNKGIMNGISGLALATGNDVRAIEAAAHAWASRDGSYRGLGSYWIEGNKLLGELVLPLPFAVTGGAVDFHPTSRWSLNLLGNPDAPGLSRIAAALGLLQNLAALRSLVSEGIQQGHMNCHAKRLSLRGGGQPRAIASKVH